MTTNKKKRVVITGLGIVSPFGIGLESFNSSILNGDSAISFDSEIAECKLSCKLSARPPIDDEQYKQINKSLGLVKMKSRIITYGLLSVREAWEDAGLNFKNKPQEARWDTGCIYGSNSFSQGTLSFLYDSVKAGKVRRLGSAGLQLDIIPYISGALSLGNATYSTAQACATGTNATILAYERIANGLAKRMVAGSSETEGPVFVGAHDALHILCRTSNDDPTQASRPMSVAANGIIPGSGAAALILEEYEYAKARGAKIYAEIVGGAYNNGGQVSSGTRTMPNPNGITRVISEALRNASIQPTEIDSISGHLTSTKADPIEIASWVKALGLRGKDFPYINSLKSMIGHSLAAAGSMAIVASVLQIKNKFLHPSLNCDDLHPEIAKLIDPSCIPNKSIVNAEVNTVIQASFGFGDTNAAIVLRKVEE